MQHTLNNNDYYSLMKESAERGIKQMENRKAFIKKVGLSTYDKYIEQIKKAHDLYTNRKINPISAYNEIKKIIKELKDAGITVEIFKTMHHGLYFGDKEIADNLAEFYKISGGSKRRSKKTRKQRKRSKKTRKH